VGARILGNIVHDALEELYKPILGKILNKRDFIPLLENSEEALKISFEKEYGKGDYLHGKNHLVYKIAHSFIQNVIHSDQKIADSNEFIVHNLEVEMFSTLM